MRREPNIENLNNIVVWNSKAFQLVDVSTNTSISLFEPAEHGFATTAICNDCQSGYYCTYQVEGSALTMIQLNIMTADGQYSEFDGVEPAFCSDDHSMEYRKMLLAIDFTGVIRIGRGRLINAFRWCPSLGPGHLLELWDLEFQGGKLLNSSNQMDLAARQIEAQNQIFKFLSCHNHGFPRIRQLFNCCTYRNNELWSEKAWDHPDQHIFDSIRSIFGTFQKRGISAFQNHLEWDAKRHPYPFFDSLQPEIAIEALAMVKTSRWKPAWFIAKYGDTGLSRQLTFGYLRELGVPFLMVRFLKKQVRNGVTEKMIILEFLESMCLTVAADQWEERVVPGHLYTDAQIPSDVTASIRTRVAKITINSWG